VFRCGEVARESNAAANRHRCSLLQLVLVAHPQLSRGPEPLRPGSPAWRYCSVSWPAGHRSKVSSSGPSVHRRSGCTAPRSRPQQLSPSFSGTGCLCGVHLAFARCSHGRSCNTLGIFSYLVNLALLLITIYGCCSNKENRPCNSRTVRIVRVAAPSVLQTKVRNTW